MDRALRLVAFIALGVLALFVAGLILLSLLAPSTESGTSDVVPALVINLGGQAAYILSLAAGVIGLVAAVQRRQVGWVVLLVVALGIAFPAPYLALEFAPRLVLVLPEGGPDPFLLIPVFVLIPEVLVPVVTLLYAYLGRRPLRASSTPPMPAGSPATVVGDAPNN